MPVYLDTALFTGPSVNPGWEEGDVSSGQYLPYPPDCARIAHGAGQSRPQATRCARRTPPWPPSRRSWMRSTPTGKEPGLSFTLAEHATAPTGATEVGSVESATLFEQAQHMMLESDNALAEVLGRYAAIAAGRRSARGRPADGTADARGCRRDRENLVQADVRHVP